MTEGTKQKPSRINRATVREAINTAELDLRWCGSVVAALRTDPIESEFGRLLVDFQPRLLGTLVTLEAVYRSIKQEEKRLIRDKIRFSVVWFKRRMRALKSYSKTIQDVLAIGRALGDSFAWFFYEDDGSLVAEHLKLQRQVLLPPLIGGMGERIAIERLQGLGGNLLVYHGTTTFLRMGDVSFIDLSTLRVAAICEIKTQKVGQTEYIINLSILSDRKNALSIPKMLTDGGSELVPSLDQSQKSRLDRQIKELGEAMSRATSHKPDGAMDHQGEFHFSALEEVVERCNPKSFTWEKAGEGLVIGALRVPGSALGSRLIDGVSNPTNRVAGSERYATQIIDISLPDNSLSLNTIGAGQGNLLFYAESLPFCSWPISKRIIDQILFGEVMVMTIYNPAHLWNAIRSRGYEIQYSKEKRDHVAISMREDRRSELHALGYFHRLISRSLMSQESVLAMFDQFVEFSEAFAPSGASKITLDPRARSRPSLDAG